MSIKDSNIKHRPLIRFMPIYLFITKSPTSQYIKDDYTPANYSLRHFTPPTTPPNHTADSLAQKTRHLVTGTLIAFVINWLTSHS